jgi:hypothetical protein
MTAVVLLIVFLVAIGVIVLQMDPRDELLRPPRKHPRDRRSRKAALLKR